MATNTTASMGTLNNMLRETYQGAVQESWDTFIKTCELLGIDTDPRPYHGPPDPDVRERRKREQLLREIAHALDVEYMLDDY